MKAKRGDRVELVAIHDEHTSLPAGLRGTVDFIDDAGTVHVAWDNGSALGLVPDVDRFEVIDVAQALAEVRGTLLALARQHRTVIPPPELTAAMLAECAGRIRALIPRKNAALSGAMERRVTAELAKALPDLGEVGKLGSDTNLAALVDSLSEAARIRLKTALADHTHRSAHTRLVGYVRDAIATAEDIEPAAKPYAVIFDADEWDNGHFVCGRGDVVEADGQSVGGLRLADDVEAAITDAYGHVASGAALAVRLSDGEVIFDDDKSFVYQELGLIFRP